MNSIVQYLVTVVGVVSKAILPILAVIGSIIAYQQYQITRTKLKLDLFEKRLSVYKDFVEFALKVADGAEIKPEHYKSLRNSFYNAQFLFKAEVVKYLEKFIANSKELKKTKAMQGSQNISITDIQKNSEVEVELVNFFQTQALIELYKKFSPYLTIYSK